MNKTLYKHNNNAVQVWNIKQQGRNIVVKYGRLNGKIQTVTEVIEQGKNIGKKNETTPEQQAQIEAQSKYEKKLKDGYVTTVEAALKGETDSLIQGGVVPMLAHRYDKYAHKVKFPCFVQPKFDGIRCIAVYDRSTKEVSLWTRTRKRISSCPHIVEQLKPLFEQCKEIGSTVVLDGELYNHNLKHNFEKIVSAVRRDKPSMESLLINYHVYDIVSEGNNAERDIELNYMFEEVDRSKMDNISSTHTIQVHEHEEILMFHDKILNLGFEGTMVRNLDGNYKHGRSYDLLKVKDFTDAEFRVIGVNEGRGKLKGLVGAFKCVTSEGNEFEVKPMGQQEVTAKYVSNPELAIGRFLNVRYFRITNKGVPYLPVGVRFRDSEDF